MVPSVVFSDTAFLVQRDLVSVGVEYVGLVGGRKAEDIVRRDPSAVWFACMIHERRRLQGRKVG